MQAKCKGIPGGTQQNAGGMKRECRGHAGGFQWGMHGKCRENAGSISSKRAFFLLVLWVATLVCLPCSRHEFMRVWTNASTHYVLIQVMRAQFVAGM
jgi:hypothetical protein